LRLSGVKHEEEKMMHGRAWFYLVQSFLLAIALACPLSRGAETELQSLPADSRPPAFRVQVRFEGTDKELRAVCGYVEARLNKLGVRYIDRCNLLRDKEKAEAVVFTFSVDDVEKEPVILNYFSQAFLEGARMQSGPYSDFAFKVSKKPCIRKKLCDGAERWWPCDCE
jgi:hypothetical protein